MVPLKLTKDTPYLTLRASYGMSFVSILTKIDPCYKGFNCINTTTRYSEALLFTVQLYDKMKGIIRGISIQAVKCITGKVCILMACVWNASCRQAYK